MLTLAHRYGRSRRYARSTLTTQDDSPRGFTLIELLVVVAILALLSSILFPAFSRARENARRASCLSNMKQIGLAVMQYADDNDEKMVNAYMYYGPGNTNLMWWQDMMQPYIKSYQLVVCPSQVRPTSYAVARPAGRPNPLRTSYAANNIYNDWAGVAITPPLRAGQVMGRPLAAFEEPATTLVFGEVVSNFDVMNAHNGMEFFDWSHTDMGSARRVDKRHLGGSSYIFADGHAKWLKDTKREMWTLRLD